VAPDWAAGLLPASVARFETSWVGGKKIQDIQDSKQNYKIFFDSIWDSELVAVNLTGGFFFSLLKSYIFRKF
jgi:hypothetical protein